MLNIRIILDKQKNLYINLNNFCISYMNKAFNPFVEPSYRMEKIKKVYFMLL